MRTILSRELKKVRAFELQRVVRRGRKSTPSSSSPAPTAVAAADDDDDENDDDDDVDDSDGACEIRDGKLVAAAAAPPAAAKPTGGDDEPATSGVPAAERKRLAQIQLVREVCDGDLARVSRWSCADSPTHRLGGGEIHILVLIGSFDGATRGGGGGAGGVALESDVASAFERA